ncbi:hypothetical protein [Lentzea sp. NPDC092896]|uniref:hypothetical protein n=1 Tax=Lentzea sp. NPDC092896 TaxID=3364127 RepID=UPI00380626F0
MVGDEAHIAARSPGGPRHGQCPPGLVDDYSNLILLCRVDHKRVDDQPGHFTVALLRRRKAEHEAWVERLLAARPTLRGKDPEPIFAEVLADGFTGRAWVLDAIDEFIATHPSGFVWIDAEAGLGKTSLAAHLVRERGWLSHFTRYARGRESASALGNLAAQLAFRCRLAPVTETVTPEAFEALLTEAAKTSGGPLVLVVDGLDEADAVEGMLPWGLPRVLPPGVFVVGTCRTGHRPGRVDSPSAVLPIAADDPRNRDDLTRHLSHVVQEKALAERLAAANIGAADFVTALSERCGGVWVYLRYVLAEVRLGHRRADDIASLPASLGAYYAEHLERWTEPGVRTLLSTLAVAREPLTVKVAAALSGEPEGSVRGWCVNTLRPFLTASAGTPRRFSIHHASFRELLTGAPPAGADDLAASLAETLAEEAVACHDRIADRYLTLFADLGNDLATAQVDEGYALRHLAAHLVGAGRPDNLDGLLRMEHRASGNRVVNTWLTAKNNDPTGFVEDRKVLRDSTPDLAVELRCRLIESAVEISSSSYPGTLLVALLKYGVWPLERVFANALRAPRTLGEVAHELPEELLPRALDAVLALDSDWLEGEAIEAMASCLPPELLDRALAHTWKKMRKTDHRVTAELGLFPHLSAAQQGKVLLPLFEDIERISHLSGHRSRVRKLAVSARTVWVPLVAKLISDSPKLSDWARYGLLSQVQDRSPAKYRHVAIDALAAAKSSLEGVERRCADLIDSGTYDVATATSLLDDIAALSDHRSADCLAVLGEHLEPAAATRALGPAMRMSNRWSRLIAVAALVGRAAPGVRGEAILAATTDFRHNSLIEAELEQLLRHIPHEALLQVVDELCALESSYFELLRPALRTAPPEIRSAALDLVLNSIRDADLGHAGRLADFIDVVLPENRLEFINEVLAAARSNRYSALSFSSTLAALQPTIESDRTDLEIAADVSNAFELAETGKLAPLLRLAPHLPDPERAFDIVSRTPKPFDRGVALAVLGRHLSPADRVGHVALALDAVNACGSTERHVVLSTLADQMSADQVEQALRTRSEPGTATDVAMTLTQLAGHPAFSLTSNDILNTVTEIDRQEERALALVAMAALLAGPAFARAIEIARSLDQVSPRALALLRLAHAAGRADLVTEGLQEAAKIGLDVYYNLGNNTRVPTLEGGTVRDSELCGIARPYSARPVTPVLVAVGEIGTAEADEVLVDLLRKQAGWTHPALEALVGTAPFLSRILGASGVAEVRRTLHDIQRWWP